MTTTPKLLNGVWITDDDPLQVKVMAALELSAAAISSLTTALEHISATIEAPLGQGTAAQSLPVVGASDWVPQVVGAIAPVAVEFTRPADTSPYTAGDVVSDSTSATTMQVLAIARAADKSGYLVGLRLVADQKSITPRIRVHLYKASGATISADNAAFQAKYVDETKKIGVVDLPAMTTSADTANSTLSKAEDFTIRIPFVPASGTVNIFYVLEALDAFTPANAGKFKLTAWADCN